MLCGNTFLKFYHRADDCKVQISTHLRVSKASYSAVQCFYFLGYLMTGSFKDGKSPLLEIFPNNRIPVKSIIHRIMYRFRVTGCRFSKKKSFSTYYNSRSSNCM